VIFLIRIHVVPKAGVLDTQGKAVEATLRRIGHEGLREVRVGRFLQMRLEAESPEAAQREAELMCRELLANDLIEDVRIQVSPEAEAR